MKYIQLLQATVVDHIYLLDKIVDSLFHRFIKQLVHLLKHRMGQKITEQIYID